jgi:hypothetical protein
VAAARTFRPAAGAARRTVHTVHVDPLPPPRSLPPPTLQTAYALPPLASLDRDSSLGPLSGMTAAARIATAYRHGALERYRRDGTRGDAAGSSLASPARSSRTGRGAAGTGSVATVPLTAARLHEAAGVGQAAGAAGAGGDVADTKPVSSDGGGSGGPLPICTACAAAGHWCDACPAAFA